MEKAIRADVPDALRAAAASDKAPAMVSAERLEGIDMPTLKEQGVDWDRRIERIETRPAVVLSLLGLMVAVRRDGCDAVRAQLLAMSAERGA